MFNISDRLKAAVKDIEAHGTNLQTRAIGQQQQQQGQSSPHPLSPIAPVKSTSIASPVASPTVERTHLHQVPTRTASGNYVAQTGQLAESALHSLAGFRKGFNFGSRTSLDGQRPVASVMQSSPVQQELKDIPPSPAAFAASSSRPSSPARFPFTSHFAVGSDPSSVNATPQLPRSPGRSPRPGKILLPSPDPSDPATYPLPSSPIVTAASPLTTALTSTEYSDPLGASPAVPFSEEPEPPDLQLEEPPPVVEQTMEALFLSSTPNEEAEKVEGVAGSIETQKADGTEAKKEDIDHQSPAEPKVFDGPPSGFELSGSTEEKLAEAERLYDDLSKRFSSLSLQRDSADRVLTEFTPLEGGIADHEALEGWVRMMRGKVDMLTEEMKRLQDRIALQDSRLEEIRDMHRLEGSSQNDLIAKLRTQLSTAETSVAAKTTELHAMTQLKADLAKAQTSAKEEEEKRSKAMSLLKTVRQRLVKVEKDKEELEKDRAEERVHRSQASEEVEQLKAEREREVNNLRKGFERELGSAKERYEKDVQTKKAVWELEMITTKATHAKDLSNRSTKINGLESIVKELNLTKQRQFEDIQARQAEVDSARSEAEALQTRTKELEFQLREATERTALLEDTSTSHAGDRSQKHLGLGLANGGQTPSPSPSRQNSYSNVQSAAEVQRAVAEAEARTEARLSDLRSKIRSLEKERNEAEEEWATKLQERVRELEKLRRQVQEKENEYADSLRTRKEKEARIDEQDEERKALEKEMRNVRAQVEEVREDVAVAGEAERVAREEISSLGVQISTFQAQLDDAKNHSTQLRTANKTLREELRKVQSSAQLMERQRNPGVGYWSAVNAGPSGSTAVPSKSGIMSPPVTVTEPATPTTDRQSIDGDSVHTGSRAGRDSPTISDKGKDKEEEEVNLEYLRNVILQFLEHKEMRANLVRVLSVILRFTPQELRRLNAKLLT